MTIRKTLVMLVLLLALAVTAAAGAKLPPSQIGPGDGDSGCSVYTAGTLAYWSGHQWVCSWIDAYGAYLWVPIS